VWVIQVITDVEPDDFDRPQAFNVVRQLEQKFTPARAPASQTKHHGAVFFVQNIRQRTPSR
jgi:hypothetical protein